MNNKIFHNLSAAVAAGLALPYSKILKTREFSTQNKMNRLFAGKKRAVAELFILQQLHFLSQRAGIFRWSKAQIVLELAGEMLGAGKAHVGSNGAHAQLSLAEQVLAFFQADLGDVLPRRNAQVGIKQAAEIGDAYMDFRGQLLQAGWPVAALGDDLQRLVHDLVFRPGGGGQDRGACGTVLGRAQHLDQDDLQKGFQIIIGKLRFSGVFREKTLERVPGAGGQGEGLSLDALQSVVRQIESDGEKAYLFVGILHMPVFPADDGDLSLMKDHVCAVDQVVQ